ncbi:MAG TPA: DUF167 domain-containing protein [Chloroflexota bacterium]|nr:DUF167 domain-containing protein [Chloroflexota bacterium]
MLRLTVVAHPGARAERVEYTADGILDVAVIARPVEGQANVAIERAVASALGLRPRQVRLTGGARSRRKIVDIDLTDLATLHERLLAHRLRPS